MRQSLISLLQCALVSPEDHFRTLWNRVDAALCEPPVVDRQGLFAESKIYLKTEGYAMIYMPLSKYHINISPKLMCSDSTILAPYTLLKDELNFYDNEGNYQSVDVMLQYITDGVPLAYAGLKSDEVLAILAQLKEECHRIGFSHNNLTPYDIMIREDSTPYLIRCHYATFTGAHDNFDSVCHAILSNEGSLADAESLYITDDNQRQEGSCFTRYNHAGLYGYKDHRGQVVIRPQFKWAGDFYEHRAVVRTRSGYGVIDTSGNFVLLPMFDTLYYNVSYTIFYTIVNNNPTAKRRRGSFDVRDYEIEGYDYNGNQIEAGDARLGELLAIHMRSIFVDR